MDQNQNDPADIKGLDIEGLETRTSAFAGQREPKSCRRCGEPVRGRRRNGYCGDKCRMQDARDRDRQRRLELLDTISATVEELRREVLR